jgi:hypothetical protein
MSSKSIRPSTLDGIKRLAKRIKVERAIRHSQALDESAQLAGFPPCQYDLRHLPPE